MAIRRGGIFNYIRPTKVAYSTFDVGYENKISCKMGKLVPFFCKELVPGDRVKLNSSFFVRTAPMVNPIMHRVDVRYHYFFVPFRLLWKNWTKFRAEGDGQVLASQRADYTAPIHPWLSANGRSLDTALRSCFRAGSVTDYLSVFPASMNTEITKVVLDAAKISPMRLAAYFCIYDNYYRVQDTEMTFPDYLKSQNIGDGESYLSDGANPFEYFNNYIVASIAGDWSHDATEDVSTDQNYLLLTANWEKDYFTSALPSPQLGPAVNVPLAGTAPVRFTYDNYGNQDHIDLVRTDGNVASPWALNALNHTRSQDELTAFAQLDRASSVTITDLRSLFQLQRLRERLAQAGTRYKEWLLAIFGMNDKDSRLDRPEYLGGGSQPVQISEVLQTSETDQTPLGDYAGRGISAGSAHMSTYQAPEDGVLMGIMSITPRTAYYQGIPRQLLYRTPYDYFHPYFEHVGEQEVFREELYANYYNLTQGRKVFGYQSRYCEYKYSHDEVHGDFTQDSYLSWHLARKFDTNPVLSTQFMKVPQMDRIFAVTAPQYDKFYCDIFNKFIANRPMSKFSEPF